MYIYICIYIYVYVYIYIYVYIEGFPKIGVAFLGGPVSGDSILFGV